MEVVQKSFRPEFINRIDDIVVFHPLGTQQIRAIVDIQLIYLRKRLAERNMDLTLDDARARPAGRGRLRSGVRRTAAEARHTAADREPARHRILQGEFGPGDRIRVGARDGELTFAKVDGRRRAARAERPAVPATAVIIPSRHEAPLMPFYEYECQACKYYTEVMQKITRRTAHVSAPPAASAR